MASRDRTAAAGPRDWVAPAGGNVSAPRPGGNTGRRQATEMILMLGKINIRHVNMKYQPNNGHLQAVFRYPAE
jgi:hypothetical protein